MIVKSIKSPTSMYGKYFLANEAPEEVQPGAKVKVITVKPDNRKRKDFSDIPDEVLFEQYGGISFVKDDFFCNCL